jgi:hypothetical protein
MSKEPYSGWEFQREEFRDWDGWRLERAASDPLTDHERINVLLLIDTAQDMTASTHGTRHTPIRVPRALGLPALSAIGLFSPGRASCAWCSRCWRSQLRWRWRWQ